MKKIGRFVSTFIIIISLYSCKDYVDGQLVKSEQDAINYANREIAKKDFKADNITAEMLLLELSDGTYRSTSYVVKYFIEEKVIYSICVSDTGKVSVNEGEIKECPSTE